MEERRAGLVLALVAGICGAQPPESPLVPPPGLPAARCGDLVAHWRFGAEFASLRVANLATHTVVRERLVAGLAGGPRNLPAPAWDTGCTAVTFDDGAERQTLAFDPAELRLAAQRAPEALRADRVVVSKRDSRLDLMREGRVLGSFRVAFGAEPAGHKQREGDERTPEGRYRLDYRKLDSAFHRSIHVSYPNAEDRERAASRGEDPGGAIMIHGQPNGSGWLAPIRQWFDWTNGCIALSNRDMDAVWRAVDAGTPIDILP